MRSPGCTRPGPPCARSPGGWAGRPSTVSRELAPQLRPRTGRYQPGAGDRLAWQRQRRPKASKLAANPVLRAAGAADAGPAATPPTRSPGGCGCEHPDDPAHAGQPRDDLPEPLRLPARGAQTRAEGAPAHAAAGAPAPPRPRREPRPDRRRGVRSTTGPTEVEGRLVPGHHEGDLIMGSMASNSAVGDHRRTHSPATSPWCTCPHGHDADAVADAVSRPDDRPARLVRQDPDLGPRQRDGPPRPDHRQPPASRSTSPTPTAPGSAAATRTPTACCASTSPKAPTCPSTPPPTSQTIADELNDRPRKRLGYHTPRETR